MPTKDHLKNQNDTSYKLPLVSIVIPVYNNERYIARALDTATSQSLKNIEVVCVDDASTDDTVTIIEKYARMDARVKLIRQQKNQSAFQARYAGIVAAQANHILFMDGDDEVHRDTARLSYKQAIRSGSDIVGFGSRIIREDGLISREFERSAQPTHNKLTGSDIVAKLFEPHQPAQGSLWRYLFSKKLLLKAYSYFPEGQQLHRSNDLPISFLSAALAKKYTSIKTRLYTYHFYAGGSGSNNFDLEKFQFYTKALDSIDVLGDIISTNNFSETVKESYRSTRLFVLSNILRQTEKNLPAKYHKEAIRFLLTKAGLDEVTAAVAGFIPEALDTLRNYLPPIKTREDNPKNIAIFTNNLHTGGVQGVAVSQAQYLQKAGFNVTIVLLRDDNIALAVPTGVDLVLVKRGPIQTRLPDFKSILIDNEIDAVIDHNVLYNPVWPFFNLIAKSQGVQTLAWIHNFSIRSLTEGNFTGKFLIDNIQLIDKLVVLSKPDVSYWKSLGHKNVHYLPNPPSPLLLENKGSYRPKKAPKKHLNILWFGRLQQATKKVYSLVDIASELNKITDAFTLTIVGPDGADLKIDDLKKYVKQRKLEDRVKVVGPKHGNELVDELRRANVFLSTSSIEGYPLTLTEAQSYSLPVVMYELPWLAITENNAGIIQTPQQNPAVAAQALYDLLSDEGLYKQMSKVSIDASTAYLSYDFSSLYTQLLQNKLSKEFSPDIDPLHLGMFAEWTQFFLSELSGGGSSDTLKSKDAEIAALKNSKAMKVGNAIAEPVRRAKTVKHRLTKLSRKK